MGPRLRELVPAAKGGQEAESRNLVIHCFSELCRLLLAGSRKPYGLKINANHKLPHTQGIGAKMMYDYHNMHFILSPAPAEVQSSARQSPLPVPVVSKVIPVQGATGGARPGARGAAGDAGEALRVPGVRQEVLEVGRSVGSQEDSCGQKVEPFLLVKHEISVCDNICI